MAVAWVDKASAGRMTWARRSTIRSQPLKVPSIDAAPSLGSQPSCTENRMISSRPSPKDGMEKDRTTKLLSSRSGHWLRQVAMMAPKTIPSTSAVT